MLTAAAAAAAAADAADHLAHLVYIVKRSDAANSNNSSTTKVPDSGSFVAGSDPLNDVIGLFIAQALIIIATARLINVSELTKAYRCIIIEGLECIQKCMYE